MEIIIAILIIISFCFGMKINEIKKESKEVKKRLQETIDSQRNELQAIVQEKENAQSKVASYEKEIDNMRKEVEALERKLDFYKNIKEESGNLNVTEDSREREELLEKTVQQINSVNEKEDKQTDYLDNTRKKELSVLDSEQEYARSEIENSNKNFFITGKAGTGKSFLLDVFRRTTNKKHIVLAPTGIAALNVKGATLHSTFGYHNLVNLDVDSISSITIRLKSEKRMMLKEVSTNPLITREILYIS